jgi:hypothetical protein
MPIPPVFADDGVSKVRRIKSNHDLGDVVMDLNDKKAIEGIPEEILQILTDMTLGGTEQLHLWEVEKVAQVLERVKSACAPQQGGKPSYEQCNEGVDLLMQIMKAKNENHPEMVYTHLPEQLQSVFKCWDLDGSGSVSATELHAAAGAWTKMHDEKTLLKRLLFGAVLIMLMLFVGIFVLGMVTSEISKEFKSSSGAMVDKSGRAVRVANAGFDVSSDGTLQVMGPQGQTSCTGDVASCARRLAADGGNTLVSTQKVRKEKALHSALADSFFDALDEITIHSEKGHRLNLKISGFARVPVLGSRCGNVVHLFSVVDGHLTLDSTDISFSGHLESLFAKAGFEIAVGGAAGRRLGALQTVVGFFNHVQDAQAAGWTCKDVPLPKTPKTSILRSVSYTPCSSSSLGGKVARDACDSKYGGFIAGVAPIPAQHLDAVSSRLENVRRNLGQDVDADRVQYSTVKQTVMHSPSFQVQFNTYPNHPAQEQVIVLNKALKQGVSFQRMVSGSVARTFCAATDMGSEPVTHLEQAELSGVNASLHMEFIGVVSEQDGSMYRHWRVMPSDSFKKWMVGEGDKSVKEYFEFWDDAQSLQPYRILDSTGGLTVFQQSQEGVTDADVDAALGVATSLSCGKDETDAFHPVYGMIPAMHSPVVDPSEKELDFYVQLLAEDIESRVNVTESEDLSEQARASADVSADTEEGEADNSSTTAEQEQAKMREAWAAMKTTRAGDSEHEFAAYALRSRELFAMPDACADVCLKPLAAAQAAVEQAGQGAFCSTAPAQALLECLADLEAPLLNSCQQSPFQSNVMDRCAFPAKSLQASTDAKVAVLADGTHAVDLGALGVATRQRLSAGLDEALGGQSLGDLSGARLLVNASLDRKDVVIAGALASQNVPSTRRLGLIEWCGDHVFPYCFKIGVPSRCEDDDCKFYLEVKIGLPYSGSPYFSLEVALGGSVNLLDKFLGIPNPPVYGEVGAGGGIKFSTKPACPGKINFSLEGYVQMSAGLGLDLLPGLLPRINLLKITLRGGAYIKKNPGYYSKHDHSRRRSCGCGERRRGWGNWSRRRRAQWVRKWHNGTCDVVVYIKATVEILCIRGWLLIEYYIMSKRFLITLGADYYEIWKLFWGSWKNFGSYVIMDLTR